MAWNFPLDPIPSAEIAVIGALLANNRCYDDISWLNMSDFSHPGLREMFGLITALSDTGEAYDAKFMVDQGFDRDLVLECLLNLVTLPATVRHCAELIRKNSRRPRLVWKGRQ